MPDEQLKQKSNTTTIIIIIVVVLGVLGVGGYLLKNYLARKTAEALISATTGGALKVNTKGDDSATLQLGDLKTSTGSLAKWPTDLPISVPEYTGGTIKASTKLASDQTWMITYEKTTVDAVAKYKAALATAGWTADVSNATIVDISTYTKDSWQLSLVYDQTSNGVQITISPKK